MMCFLIQDVLINAFYLRMPVGKHAVTRLSFKMPVYQAMAINEIGCIVFYIAD